MHTGRKSRKRTASRHALLLVALSIVGAGPAPLVWGSSKPTSAERAVRERASVLGVEDRAASLGGGGSEAWPLEDGSDADLAVAGITVIDAPPDVVLARVQDLSLLRERGAIIAAGRVGD